MVVGSGTVLTFLIMMLQEAGFGHVPTVFSNWLSYYFHTFDTSFLDQPFFIFPDFKLPYLITLVVMSGVFAGYLRSKDAENIIPWLFGMLYLFIMQPTLGKTRVTSQFMVTMYYGFIIGCVAMLTSHGPKKETDIVEEDEELDEDAERENGYAYKRATDMNDFGNAAENPLAARNRRATDRREGFMTGELIGEREMLNRDDAYEKEIREKKRREREERAKERRERREQQARERGLRLQEEREREREEEGQYTKQIDAEEVRERELAEQEAVEKRATKIFDQDDERN